MIKIVPILSLMLFLASFQATAQKREISGPVYIDSAKAVEVSAISKRKLKAPSSEYKLFNPRNRGINKVVPGKGLPKALDKTRQKEFGKLPVKEPKLTFDAATSRSTPTDPTGAAGPNHYVNGWNSAFSIFDKNGNQVSPPASLASIGGEFSNETLGDPIILYDEFADRFLITQFSDTPESFLVAVSKGSDPVNDGWNTYRFPTGGALPDYPKISVWSDGYYVTTNKNSNTASTSQVVYVFERDKMLTGATAKVVSFPLPGINTNGFYSPAGFHAMGGEIPPKGNSPIVFMQDDAWAGVSEDHLKIWNINVDWNVPANSTIAESQELGPASGVSPFIATFDGGAFSNLSQPGEAPDLDVLQATMMYMTQYRRFPGYNSAVMNFVVDIDPTAAEHAGIRWYELRQDRNGGAWSVYQEGTYAPDKSDRFSGSMGMDKNGNIGLAFTVLDDSPETPIFPSLRYTGRYSNDPLGLMTVKESTIVEGRSPDPSSRYGDYAHLTVDPADDISFWHNGEYFEAPNRKNKVGVFKLAADVANDVGIIALVDPVSSTLGSSEAVTVTIRNFGEATQSNFPVSYSVNGGQTVTETFTGSVAGTTSVDFTFSTPSNLSVVGQLYEFIITTNLEGDQNSENDALTVNVKNLFPKDVGITSIDSPYTGLTLSSAEDVTVTIENFGGEPQSNIPVIYRLGNNREVSEIYPGTIGVGENAVHTFSSKVNLSRFGRYTIYSETNLEGDGDPANDAKTKSVANLNCIPEGSDCDSFGDGISYFELGDILNERIPCTNGYADFIGFSTDLDRSKGTFTVTVKTLFDSSDDEKFSMWIDLNDNGVFDDDELLISRQTIPSGNTAYSYDFSLQEEAPLGQHLLRIRAGDTSFDGELNNPCSVMQYGTTHDYSVRITDSTLSLDDFLLNEANLLISDQRDGLFTAFLETQFDQRLRVTVHNILGQKMLENMVDNNGNGYEYNFDMSYGASGVYLLRIGTRKVGVVKRFIVK
ncbi:GEVED domain-containing protein [Gillisia sp. M10.2A]|uniref:GEVED domain-containing protein n=1 Tax=Gillisia lutea TaxID=2909668 RepID=A0ABS9EG92_9FLAO|nr:GEVED domain-containing protein [Gillisia lutea]MCF4100486.1 GEVED domain-containing protein [Gillisia lutea]